MFRDAIHATSSALSLHALLRNPPHSSLCRMQKAVFGDAAYAGVVIASAVAEVAAADMARPRAAEKGA